jgi:hypothetical protein
MRQSTGETNPRPPHGQRTERAESRWVAAAELSCASRLHMRGPRFRAHPGGPPDREPASMRAVTVRRLVVVHWRRCVGPVDRGRSPRLDRGRSPVVPSARQGARARQRGGASRSCRLATRGPNCGPSAIQARATANVSSTPRVRPPSCPPDCRRCPPPYGRPRPRPSGGEWVTPPGGGATSNR